MNSIFSFFLVKMMVPFFVFLFLVFQDHLSNVRSEFRALVCGPTILDKRKHNETHT